MLDPWQLQLAGVEGPGQGCKVLFFRMPEPPPPFYSLSKDDGERSRQVRFKEKSAYIKNVATFTSARVLGRFGRRGAEHECTAAVIHHTFKPPPTSSFTQILEIRLLCYCFCIRKKKKKCYPFNTTD